MAVFNGKQIMLAGIKSPCLYKHALSVSTNYDGTGTKTVDFFIITTKAEKYTNAAEFVADLSNVVSMEISDTGVRATAFLITTSNIDTYAVLSLGYYYSTTTTGSANADNTSLKIAQLPQAVFSSTVITQL